MLYALCIPNKELKKLQDENRLTELMVRQEEMKTMPFGEIWNEYCRQCGTPEDGTWFQEIKAYETEVLSKRGEK